MSPRSVDLRNFHVAVFGRAIAGLSTARLEKSLGLSRSKSRRKREGSRRRSGARTHQVVSGDSLWRIATSYDCSIADIKALNGLQDDRIYAGQSLRVPVR